MQIIMRKAAIILLMLLGSLIYKEVKTAVHYICYLGNGHTCKTVVVLVYRSTGYTCMIEPALGHVAFTSFITLSQAITGSVQTYDYKLNIKKPIRQIKSANAIISLHYLRLNPAQFSTSTN